MKIYTKTGDTGQTSLLTGKRVSKAHLRLDAYGTVDELNTLIGSLRDQPGTFHISEDLISIQTHLFSMGSWLALEPGKTVSFPMPVLNDEEIIRLEDLIDEMEDSLPALTNFVLPGGHAAVSAAHVARTVCRRAERIVVHLFEEEPGPAHIVMYLNRLSDYLFVLSRSLTHRLKVKERPWKPDKK